MRTRRIPSRGAAALLAVVALLLAACGSSTTSSSSTSATPDLSARPSSAARVAIVSPTAGQILSGATVHVAVQLTGAKVIAQTTTHVRPDQGHVHLYLDSQLIYMQYSLQQDVPVKPGTYVLKAEFVASDHVPFNPRVWSNQIVFTVS